MGGGVGGVIGEQMGKTGEEPPPPPPQRSQRLFVWGGGGPTRATVSVK